MQAEVDGPAGDRFDIEAWRIGGDGDGRGGMADVESQREFLGVRAQPS